MIKRILVPIDGSEHADKALEYALKLADKYEADIEILNVVSTAPIPIGPYPMGHVELRVPAWVGAYSKELKASHEKMLSEALEKAKKNKPNLNISTKLVKGRPADKIVETAKQGNFDIVIIGSRGLGGIKKFFLGSVSDRVSDDAECPVLIVK